MAFNQEDFNEFVISNKIVGFFENPITLKSGRISNWYVNWRNASNDAFLLDQLSDFLINFTKEKKIGVDCFYGVPEGATKLGIIAQFKYAKSKSDLSVGKYIVPMGRAKPKEHGDPKDKFFVGMPKGKTVVIEDVTTTGGSLLKTLDSLKEAGVNIVAAIGLTNRAEKRDDSKSVKQAVEEKGVKYFNMSSALNLLPEIIKRENINEKMKNEVIAYFEKYGVEKLNL